jgi:hypothetical protein
MQTLVVGQHVHPEEHGQGRPISGRAPPHATTAMKRLARSQATSFFGTMTSMVRSKDE